MAISSARTAVRATPDLASSVANPLSNGEFAQVMQPLEGLPFLALAVSGGVDSLSLLLLAAQWRPRQKFLPRIHVLSVNHGIRPEAVQETRFVARTAREYGLEATVLHNREPVPLSNRQAMLRSRRYELLCGWCRTQGVSALLLGHQLEDQAETFLIRLTRGSGIDGLAAMRQDGFFQGVRLYRPLLNTPKARLRRVVERSGISWIEDPSNKDPAYTRNRLRELLESLAREGLDVHRLARTAAQMGRARAALEEVTCTSLRRYARLFEKGFVIFERALLREPDEIALRALSRLLMAVGGRTYAPRLSQLERALSALRHHLHRKFHEPGRSGHRTLSGCHIFLHRSKNMGESRFFVIREPAAAARAAPLCLNRIPSPERPGEITNLDIWDGRFRIIPTMVSADLLEVRALGREGLRQWKVGSKSSAPPYPVDLCHSLPALWHEEKVLCAPHLNYFSCSNRPRVVLLRPPGLEADTKKQSQNLFS